MNIEYTSRGFEIIRFTDQYGKSCTLQQSSLPEYDIPGTSAIWFGTGDDRMHIDLKLLKELLPHLQRWAEEGTFTLPNQ